MKNLSLREFKLPAQADQATKDLGLCQNQAQSKDHAYSCYKSQISKPSLPLY